HRHDREGRWQAGHRDLGKAVFLVEPMCRQELRGGAEEYFSESARSRPIEKRIQQFLRDAMAAAAKFPGDEHLSQRGLVVPDIEKPDGSNDPTWRAGDPEVAGTAPVETCDVGQVGLRFE